MRRIGTGDGLAGIPHAADSAMREKPTGTGEGAGKHLRCAIVWYRAGKEESKMDVYKQNTHVLFNGAQILEIPFFQRSYVWDKDEWERFAADMEGCMDASPS
jgi:hypothetical protein